MANTKNTTKKETVKKETTKKTTPKEEKVMKEEIKVVEEVKVIEEKKENSKKEDKAPKLALLNIQEVTELYAESGVKCYNPTAKGNYRIMGNSKGSSLNVKPTKGYFIYSTDADYELVKEASLECDDLVVEKGTNSSDKTRPNTIICTAVETLKQVLSIYATNPFNMVSTEAE